MTSTHGCVSWQHDLELNAPLSALSSACMVLVCVDSADTPHCLKLLQDARSTKAQPTDVDIENKRQALGIISLQRGVKNSAQFADA